MTQKHFLQFNATNWENENPNLWSWEKIVKKNKQQKTIQNHNHSTLLLKSLFLKAV